MRGRYQSSHLTLTFDKWGVILSPKMSNLKCFQVVFLPRSPVNPFPGWPHAQWQTKLYMCFYSAVHCILISLRFWQADHLTYRINYSHFLFAVHPWMYRRLPPDYFDMEENSFRSIFISVISEWTLFCDCTLEILRSCCVMSVGLDLNKMSWSNQQPNYNNYISVSSLKDLHAPAP